MKRVWKLFAAVLLALCLLGGCSAEEEPAEIPEGALTCTITIRCDTVLDNMDKLAEGKSELIPADGVLLAETQAVFYEGESVFNVLQRTLKEKKMHLEFVDTPMYNSVYIEGICNLYEFDCGDLSGWMYQVNGSFPTYGCSRYELKDGDAIVWRFTCDLGDDIGGGGVQGNNG